jgi:hypothetical protein
MQLQEKLGETTRFCRHWWVTLGLLGGLFGACLNASADSSSGSRCFDFSKVITDPLRNPTNSDRSGTLPQGYSWASVRETVHPDLDRILKDLIAHGTTKSPRVNKMEIKDLKDPRYLAKQEVQFEVDPFVFVTVKWTETWAFAVTNGPQDHPMRVVISYEKTDGTSHIEHLCGSYVLERQKDGQTDVYIYEEAKATGRNEKDTLNGLKGNLKAFNQLK